MHRKQHNVGTSSILLQTHPLGLPVRRCPVLPFLRVVLFVPLLVQVPQQDVLLLCDNDLLQGSREGISFNLDMALAIFTSEGISSVGK